MPSLSPLRDTLALCLMCAAAICDATAQAPAPTFTDTQYPFDNLIVRDDERWLTGRVVDGLTGLPIAAAEVLLIAEGKNPMRGEFSFEMRSTADADGFVRIRVDKQAPGYKPWHWIAVRAPGYGPRVTSNVFERAIVRLNPAVTVPIEVRDWQDRPVADALVGFCGGCGHSPDLIHGRTGKDGVVRLAGMDLYSGIADLYIEHKDLALGYDSVDWYPGEGPVPFRVRSGVVSLGILVDQQGKPVAGAYIGTKDFHRGPWTRTAADGSFKLYGSNSPGDMFVHVADRVLLYERPPSMPFRLQLPEPREEPTEIVDLDERERALLDREEAPAPELPTVIVRPVGLPANGEIYLRTRDESHEITDLVRTGQRVALPKQPFVFVLDAKDSIGRTIACDRSRALAEGIVRLRWYEPTRIEGRVVDANGDAAEVKLAIVHISHRFQPDDAEYKVDDDVEWQVSDGAIFLTTQHERLRLLAIRGNTWNRPPRLVPIVLPERGDDAFVDVGTIVLTDKHQLTVLDPDGMPLRGGSVTLLRTGWHDLANGFTYELDGSGHCHMPDLQAGDAVLVRGAPVEQDDDAAVRLIDLPSRFAIEGSGPFELRQHGGRLLVDVRTTADDATPAVTIGDRMLRLHGPTLVRGLAPGKHKVFCAADGHRSAIAEITVPSKGRTELSVTLPPR